MPRRGRVDAPGALHHVMARGIERREIFCDDQDREIFLTRLEKALEETGTVCYAWALLPNHLHLLLVSGRKPVGRMMQAALGGYALYFNRRHRRGGHLFQNRFKSVLCEREPYLLELVRYIHLNPLRARVVRGLPGLERFPWSGHAVLLGQRQACFQDVDGVLSLFAGKAGEARRRYREFVAQGANQGQRRELTGGGLVRSLGGWKAVAEARRGRERQAADERILGGGEFVEEVLREVEEEKRRSTWLRGAGWTVARVLRRAAQVAGISVKEICQGGRRPGQCRGRWLACKWLVEDLGLKGTEAARVLGISQPAVVRGVRQGAKIETQRRVRLETSGEGRGSSS